MHPVPQTMKVLNNPEIWMTRERWTKQLVITEPVQQQEKHKVTQTTLISRQTKLITSP